MKKIIVSLFSLMAVATMMTFTSCNKDEQMDGNEFAATMEGCVYQQGKTVLEGTNLNWVSGDRVAIYGIGGSGIYSAAPQTPATTARLSRVSGSNISTPCRAYYPSTLTSDGINITLPATQTTVDGNLHDLPMYAESNNNNLAFRNLCGALKLHLTANVNISSIAITAASEISGTFSVDYNDGDPQLAHVSGGSNTTTLTCTTPLSIANGNDFFIYLPAGIYSGLQIELNTDDGFYCLKTANTTIPVTRSQYTLITLGPNDLNFEETLYEGSLPGLFTINADGDQVHFSQGNLQYQASTNTWRFAEHQYDYVGADNANISATYTGWIDLFVWGTGNNPSLTWIDYPDGTFVDWCFNPISNGGNALNAWRTLTAVEWQYLLYTRANNTNLGTNARFANGSVNGIHGVMLFPDGYTHPTGISIPIGINDIGWNANNYNLAQWAEMEAAGAVFLPAAGFRWGMNILYDESEGNYWSSSLYTYSIKSAWYFHFEQNNQYIQYWWTNNGFSVRAVR